MQVSVSCEKPWRFSRVMHHTEVQKEEVIFMQRTVLEKELQTVDTQVQRLGSLVDHALAQALEALGTNDQHQAGVVVEADRTVDEVYLAIEQQVPDILTTQQPLLGRDLRYLTSLPPIAIDLERIGDEAVEIAQVVLRLTSLYRESSVSTEITVEETQRAALLGLGQQARSMLQKTMQAFANRDAAAARAIWRGNAAMHKSCYVVQRDISTILESTHAMAALRDDPNLLQRTVSLLTVVHSLKRSADHANNICERIVYIVQNETELQPVLDEA